MIEENGSIHAVVALIIAEDPTYVYIEQGAWHSDATYGTIHRVAGDGKLHGIFALVTEFCSRKISHLRVDTHRDNQVMQHLILRNGFEECGVIYVADGTPRLAYEKL